MAYNWHEWANQHHAVNAKCWSSTSVIVRCPGTGEVVVDATICGQEESATSELEPGLAIESQHRDFVIDRADIIILAAVYVPQPGDQIELADGTIYEVRPTLFGPASVDHDRYGLRVRVHAELDYD